MTYEAPDVPPGWFKVSDSVVSKDKYDLDSFGAQWAECVEYPGGYYKCDLKAYGKDGNVYTYGRYYYSSEDYKWRMILPPGLFVYSGYAERYITGVVKGGKVVKVDGELTKWKDLVEDVVSADAVILDQ